MKTLIAHGTMLALGFIMLWWASDKSVLYSKNLARLFKLSSLFIGFVVLSISTGIPEFSIAISSLIRKVPHLSIGDIIGSNFTDIALVLGIPALFGKKIIVGKKEYVNVLSILVLVSLLMAGIFAVGLLSKIHGVTLLLVYVFCTWFFWKTRHAKEVVQEICEHDVEKLQKKHTLIKYKVAFQLFGSLALVLIASQLCVHAAINIAFLSPLDLETIGFTVMAIGTSLPEIALNISAVRAKEYSLAIGNSLGSILMQGSLILGTLVLLSPQPLPIAHVGNIAPFMFAAFAIVGGGIFLRKKINKVEGLLILGVYVFFILFNAYQFF